MRHLLIVTCLSIFAVDVSASEVVARVAATRGHVEVQLSAGSAWVATFRGDQLPEGTRVRTGPDATTRLLMTDRSVLMLGPRSELKVATYKVQKRIRRTSLKLRVGWLWARIRQAVSAEDEYEVSTTNAVAGVRGTDLIVSTDGGEHASFACLHGVVDVADAARTHSVTLANLERVAVGGSELGELETIHPSEVRNLVAPFAAAQLFETPEDPGPPPGSHPGPPSWVPPATPPVDLEPGSRTGRLRGRVEVRER